MRYFFKTKETKPFIWYFKKDDGMTDEVPSTPPKKDRHLYLTNGYFILLKKSVIIMLTKKLRDHRQFLINFFLLL